MIVRFWVRVLEVGYTIGSKLLYERCLLDICSHCVDMISISSVPMKFDGEINLLLSLVVPRFIRDNIFQPCFINSSTRFH